MTDIFLNEKTAILEIRVLLHECEVSYAIQVGDYLNDLYQQMTPEDYKKFLTRNFDFLYEMGECFRLLADNVTKINRAHYRLGVMELCDLIKSGVNLKYEELHLECKGCHNLGNDEQDDDCLLIYHNQDGQCPCTHCNKKFFCQDEPTCELKADWEDQVSDKICQELAAEDEKEVQ